MARLRAAEKAEAQADEAAGVLSAEKARARDDFERYEGSTFDARLV